MARRMDRINVIDIEATTWERGKQPPNEIAEIIKVGLSVVDLNSLVIVESYGVLIKPENSTVGDYCTKLTGITQEQVDRARWSFTEVSRDIKKNYRSRELAWGSWGDYDKRQFESQCKELNISFPFGPTHLNIKNLIAQAEGWVRECSMDIAINKLKIPTNGFVKGGDNAKLAATIYIEFLSRYRESRKL